MKITFFAACVPIAQPRQRHRIAGKPGAEFVHNFTPADSKVNTFKASIRLAFSGKHKGAPLQGPVALRFLSLFPRPKRLLWKSKPMPRAWHIQKPDLDNLEKAIKDCLTGLAVGDDCQICCVVKKKYFAAGDEQAGVWVEVETIDG